MSEMVERVARAMYERRWREVNGSAPQEQEQRFEMSIYRERYLADARAAILAMRKHLLELSGPDFSSSEYYGAIEAIDEALKGDK